MDKNILLSFINRYHLAGSCEAVMVKETPIGAVCALIDEDQTVIGQVTWKGTPFFVGDLPIQHTSTLIKMLSAIGNEVEVEVKKGPDGDAATIEITEGSTKIIFLLGNKTVIPAVPILNLNPTYDVEIPLDSTFSDKFIKAKNALPDVKNFAIQVKQGVIKVIVNYSTIKSDHISFDVGTSTENMDPICFSAEKLKDILVASKGDSGVLKISSEGLANVVFTGEKFDSSYYLTLLQN